MIAVCGVFITFIQSTFGDYLQQWGFTLQAKDVEVDEDLPNFFKTVKLSSADELVLEAQNLKDKYFIEIEDPRTIAVMDETTMPKKAIQGTPWYNVLSNQQYTEDFQYIGAHVDEREKLIKDGDENEGNDVE